jgi:hypothetical protein
LDESIIIPVVIPLIFYIFIGTLILVPVMLHYRAKEASHRVVREAIAKGQIVDPALIERLIPPPKPQDPRNLAFGFLISGIIFVAIGVGLGSSGFFLTDDIRDAGGFFSGAVITGAIGVGFLVISAVAFVLFKRPKV